MKIKVPDSILKIKPYVPGKPIEELERELGIKDSIKLASNENPLGPSPKAINAIKDALLKVNRYPDGSGYNLVEKLAEKNGVSSGNIIIGNGSDDIIGMLSLAFLRPGKEAILPKPSFLMYEIAVRSIGAIPIFVPLKSLSIDLDGIKEKITSKTRIIFLCNPNNPTGTVFSARDFDGFINSISEDIVVAVDEAYIEFSRDKDCLSAKRYAKTDRPVVTLRTFSKAYGLAGLRVGYGIMPEEIAGLLNRVRQPFNVNSLAQAGASAALDDKEFFEETIRTIHEGLDYLYNSLDSLGMKYFPTQSNFFLIDVKTDSNEVFQKLLKLGVIVRPMESYGYQDYIRVNVGLPEENERLIISLAKVLK